MADYKIEYSSEAFSQLSDLEKAVARRITKKVETTLSNPHRFFKRLSGRPEYKLRVGDYRVIADIEDKQETVFIRAIGHRRDIYRKA